MRPRILVRSLSRRLLARPTRRFHRPRVRTMLLRRRRKVSRPGSTASRRHAHERARPESDRGSRSGRSYRAPDHGSGTYVSPAPAFQERLNRQQGRAANRSSDHPCDEGILDQRSVNGADRRTTKASNDASSDRRRSDARRTFVGPGTGDQRSQRTQYSARIGAQRRATNGCPRRTVRGFMWSPGPRNPCGTTEQVRRGRSSWELQAARENLITLVRRS